MINSDASTMESALPSKLNLNSQIHLVHMGPFLTVVLVQAGCQHLLHDHFYFNLHAIQSKTTSINALYICWSLILHYA